MIKTALLVYILLGVHAKETPQDFIDKYNSYSKICERMGYHLRNSTIQEKEIIAFHALIWSSQDNLGRNVIVVFGNVTLNTGHAYDANSGIFTAPYDGVYSFTWTILTLFGYSFHTKIVLNGRAVGFNHVDGASASYNFESGSSTAIIKLRKNDAVWISTTNFGKHAYGKWSSFSGFKL